jgi:hypothetical protein
VRIVAITPGRSVDVVIAGREPITIEEGQTIEGVKVVRVDARGAVLIVEGVTRMVALRHRRLGRACDERRERHAHRGTVAGTSPRRA